MRKIHIKPYLYCINRTKGKERRGEERRERERERERERITLFSTFGTSRIKLTIFSRLETRLICFSFNI